MTTAAINESKETRGGVGIAPDPLDRINESFDLMHSGESIRTVVTFA